MKFKIEFEGTSEECATFQQGGAIAEREHNSRLMSTLAAVAEVMMPVLAAKFAGLDFASKFEPSSESESSFGDALEPRPEPRPEPSVAPSPSAAQPAYDEEHQKLRLASWHKFVDTCAQWVVGFEIEGADQPDRQNLLKELGTGIYPVNVMRMALEIGSLQRLVQLALWVQSNSVCHDLDYIQRVAGNMVQVSHLVFPDLEGMLDGSSRWRRTTPPAINVGFSTKLQIPVG